MPKKGTDPVVRLLFWVLVIIGVCAFLEFKGPYKGWLSSRIAPADKVADATDTSDAANQIPVVDENVDDVSTTTQEPDPLDVTPPVEEPPKSEMELLYEKLYAKYLEKYKPPVEGAQIRLKLKTGDDVTGSLESVSPGKITVRMKFGTMTYALHRIHPSMYPYLFPERAAKMKALAEIESMLNKRRQAAEADRRRQAADQAVREQQAAADREAAVQRQLRQKEKRAAQAAAPAEQHRFQYDPSSSKTPEHLKNTLQSFGMRLNYQQRAMGAPIAKKIYAKQQDDKVVLYMIMTKTFQAQNYDTRYAITDQLWKIWSMRCNESGKVQGPGGAHLVMLDESGKQIGGSNVDNAADIWAKQGKG